MGRMEMGMHGWLWWGLPTLVVVLLIGIAVAAVLILRSPVRSQIGREIRGGVIRRLSRQVRFPSTLPAFERSGGTNFAFLVIPDISGYTQFLKETRFAIAHAQYAICQLLEAMIAATEGLLTPMKLEGDAVFFAAGQKSGEDVASLGARVESAVIKLNSAFYQRQRQLKATSTCGCAACKFVDMLNLKTIIHAGEVYQLKVMGSDELGGMPIVAAHRLLKQEVDEESYILVTDAAAKWVHFKELAASKEITREYEGVGSLSLKVYPLDDMRLVDNEVPGFSHMRGLREKLGSLLGAIFRWRK